MPFIETGFPGLKIIEPLVHEDNRGYFFESYNGSVFSNEGLDILFVQDNQAKSSYGVIRGLHYQLNPFAQSKLVRVISGTILDVVVDLRKGSPTFGKHFSLELSAENKKQLFVPPGFAHGYSVQTETAEMFYKCDAFYNKAGEAGILFNDPALSIDWKLPEGKAIISSKDMYLPTFANCINNFEFVS